MNQPNTGVGSQAVSFLKNRPYLSVSLTHFFVDVLNNSRTLLVAILAISIGLTNAQVGVALLIYNIGSALSQPFFGLVADRFGPRWLVIGGMSWMIVLYAVGALAGDWLALVAITLAGLGSGAVHPSGTKVASETSQSARTQATALFFTAGQTGLFVGPILAGLLIEAYGRTGYLVLPLLALSAVIGSWRWVTNKQPQKEPITNKQSPLVSVKHTSSRLWKQKQTIFPLLVITVAVSTVAIATINFAPKLFTETGYRPSYVGWTAGLFMLGSAIGGVIGGMMGDRVGRRPVIFIGMLGAILPLYFYIPADDPWRFLLLFLAGFFTGMPHSILVLTAQSLFPGRRAFASGLTLGIMFFSGAVGTYLVGIIADEIGLANALQSLAILPLIAAFAGLFLPRKSAQSLPETSAAT
jgi:FSR family fosmidomycin resistance protein-like MFS transporter